MSAALAIVADKAVLGLSNCKFNTWLHRGAPIVARYRLACRAKSQAQWDLGDWLLEMDNHYLPGPVVLPRYANVHLGLDQISCYAPEPGDFDFHARPYTVAARLYGYQPATFQEFLRVARAFLRHTRELSLSWKHHQALAAMPDNDERAMWLWEAKIRKWPKAKLQSELAASRAVGLTTPLPAAQPRAYPGRLTESQKATLAALAKQTGLGVSQIKDLIVSNFLEEPTKVQEFAEAYKSP